MARNNNPTRYHIHFLRRSGEVIRIAFENIHEGIVQAAKDLEAPFLVATFERDMAADCQVWSVFAVRKAQPNTPIPGQWSLGLPVRNFTTETPDPALMWARAQLVGEPR